MTVTSQLAEQTFPGNGSTTTFAFSFNIPEAGDEQVYVTDSADAITGPLARNLYAVTGYGSPTGGQITYPLVGSPLPAGSSLTIARNLADTQETVFGNQGPYFPQAVEQALDYVTMLLQQVSAVQNRALRVPIVDPEPLPLPAAAARANQILGFDALGNPIASQPSSALVSSAMQPVVAAATLAIARSLLGLGAMATEGIGSGLQDDGAGNARVNFTTYDDGVSVNPVPANYHLTRRDATGPIAYTLGRANSYWNGFGFWISAIAGGPITINIDSHDSFIGQAAGVGLVLQVGEFAFVTCDGEASGTWYADIQGQANVPLPTNAQTGAAYTIQYTDWGALVTRSNASVMADVLPQATGQFGAGFWCHYQNVGQTAAVLTPAVGTIAGGASLFVPPGYGGHLVSDGTNWQFVGTLPTAGQTVLLNTVTVSGTPASISDLVSFTRPFSEFALVFDGLYPATANQQLLLQVYSGGAYKTTSYLGYSYLTSAGGANYYALTAGVPVSTALVNNAAPGVSGRMSVRNPASASVKKIFTGQLFEPNNTTQPAGVLFLPSGYWNGASDAIIGWRITAASGNLGGGAVKVYGQA